MRRITEIEALEILVAYNKTGFFKVYLKYGLVPPKKESPGEDGYPSATGLPVPKAIFTRDDFLDSEYHASRNILTISALQSRN